MQPSEIKAKTKLSDFIGQYVELKQDGPEYKGLCPFHDDNTPSFHVVDDKEFYHCFACGAHGDVFDFAMEYSGLSFSEAKKAVVENLSLTQETEPRKTQKSDPYAIYKPLPLPEQPLLPGQRVKVINPKRDHREWTLTPEAVYRYPGAYVLRVLINGKKITPVIHWCIRGKWQGWVLYPLPRVDRPYYGELQPGGHVVIVEGEKVTDVVQALLPRCSVLTWPGGTNQTTGVKWPDLAGRVVWLLADADQAGHEAMAEIAGRLPGAIVRSVLPDLAKYPKAWDVADTQWTSPQQFINWMTSNVTPLPGRAQPDPVPLDQPLADLDTTYHIDHVKRDKEGNFKYAMGTAENLRRLLDRYDITLRYNEIARAIELQSSQLDMTGDLASNCMGSVVEDLCRLNRYPYTNAKSHFPKLASDHTYNPVRDYINAKPWDGTERIPALFDCLTLKRQTDAGTSYMLFRKWILGAIAIALDFTDKFEHALVLVDTKGGIGKTRFFTSLCPKPLRADGVMLDPHKPDSVYECISKWLIELGEIDGTFNKATTESLKAFLSRDHDEMRRPYQPEPANFKRRTAFFGSVNSSDFLVDDTNNRRYWPIEVTAVDYEHTIDMQQVWAEALVMVQRGESWHLDREQNEKIAEYNAEHRHVSTIEELVLSAYDVWADEKRSDVNVTQVLHELGFSRPTLAEKRRAGKLLRDRFDNRILDGVRVYSLPYPKQTNKTVPYQQVFSEPK